MKKISILLMSAMIVFIMATFTACDEEIKVEDLPFDTTGLESYTSESDKFTLFYKLESGYTIGEQLGYDRLITHAESGTYFTILAVRNAGEVPENFNEKYIKEIYYYNNIDAEINSITQSNVASYDSVIIEYTTDVEGETFNAYEVYYFTEPTIVVANLMMPEDAPADVVSYFKTLFNTIYIK